MTVDLTLAEVIKDALDARIAEVHVSMPGRVESYDAATQTADIKPLLKRAQADPEGNEIDEELPVIPKVPVAFPRAGGFMITFPVVQGDTGEIIFCDWSIDQWWERGGIVDPGDLRMHSLAGAYFRPGLSAKPDALADAHATNMVIGHSGGKQTHYKDGEIAMGIENPTDWMALASLTKSEIDSLKTTVNNFINAHKSAGFHVTTATIGLGPAVGVITAPGGTTHGAIGDVKSATVKSE